MMSTRGELIYLQSNTSLYTVGGITETSVAFSKMSSWAGVLTSGSSDVTAATGYTPPLRLWWENRVVDLTSMSPTWDWSNYLNSIRHVTTFSDLFWDLGLSSAVTYFSIDVYSTDFRFANMRDPRPPNTIGAIAASFCVQDIVLWSNSRMQLQCIFE